MPFETPSWFSLSNYDCMADMGLSDWTDSFYKRQYTNMFVKSALEGGRATTN